MILAHGSGIDDAAFVVLPLLVMVALRWLNRRPRPHQDEAQDTGARGTNDSAGG
jgi:hypothetical protein